MGHTQFLLRQRFAQPGFNDDGSINTPGLAYVGNDNPDLKWESTTDFNLGLDFGFNNDRFSGNLIYIEKKPMIYCSFQELRHPLYLHSSFFQNLSDGKIVNQGVELGLSYDFLDKEDTSFSASFNISYNSNKVIGTNRIADIGYY